MIQHKYVHSDGMLSHINLFKHDVNYVLTFQEYNKELRPFIEEVQTEAVKVGLESLVPKTEEVVRKRNTTGF